MKRRLSQIKNKKKFLFFLGIYCILLIIDMKCPRCNNEDEEYFYHGSKGWYCRKCIRFKRILLSEELTPYPLDEVTEEVSPYLSYELTDFQKEISKQLCASVFKEDVLLHCVCGAGKTEIVLEAISAALNRGCKVAYAISRRQVVLELSERFKIIFPNLKVIAVCQGFTNELSGDLIVCTTHQLYRYPETFDLLIIDEPDAFPFKGDETLWNIAHTSCKGHVIYSTATLDQQMNKVKEKGRYLCLNRRPHLYPLPVPRLCVGPWIFLQYQLIQFLKRNKPVIVFVASIRLCKLYARIYRWMFRCDFVSSQSEDKQEKIDAFKKGGMDVLFSTSILERGVTIPHVKVVIIDPEHQVFDLSSMIQMLGRVGRRFDDPVGECMILSNRYSVKAKDTIKELKRLNEAEMFDVF